MIVRAPAPPEIDALCRVLAASYASTPTDASSWITAVGDDNARVLIEGGTVQAGLLTIPMGQFFGGRRVAMTGIAAVGVAPEARGRGLGTALVRGTLRDLRARAMPISALYPSTLGMYRGLGWEVAGARWEIRLEPRLIGVRERAMGIRRAGVDDVLGIRAAHLARARATPGAIDRHPFLWDRVLAPRGQDAEKYVVGDDRIDGYVFFTREPRERGRFDITLTDVVATNAPAARRILTFLADHATLADKVTWRGHPDDALIACLPERTWSVRQLDPWMLRIVDVIGALGARGWPAGFVGEVDVAIADGEIPDNDGRFVISWNDGDANVRRGGTGRVKLDVRGLAGLYSGWRSPQQLHAAGLIDGDDRSLAVLATAFAGPMPTMWDGF